MTDIGKPLEERGFLNLVSQRALDEQARRRKGLRVMRSRTKAVSKRSEGERARLLAYVIIAALGMGLGYLAVLQFNDGRALMMGMSWYETWIVLAAGLGAMLALFLAGDRVGHHGPWTMLRAVSGLIWVSLVGAIIAGTLSLPLYGTMFAPFTLVVTLATSPVIAVIWAVHMLAVNVLMAIYRSERDSVFTPERMTLAEHPDSLSVRVRGHFG